jgi:Outer membrane efflux protein
MRIYLVAKLAICILCLSARAQIPSATSAQPISTEVEASENRVSQIISRAEEHFRNGKNKLKANQREKARHEFDMAVDCILESGFDVRGNQRLQTFYLELVERIYREEVSLRIPIGNVGFRDQTFVANRNDELSKPIQSPETKSARPSSNSDGREGLRREYLSSIKEYKASLERLLAVYENNLRRAQERLETAKQLYGNGLVHQSQVDDAIRSVKVQQGNVVSTKKLISSADNKLAMALLESKQPTKPGSAVGPMPAQLANGQIPAVIRYLNDNLNDPYSMKLLKWSKLRIAYKYDQPFWYVTLRLRAKNGFGAYILREAGFYLKKNIVVFTDNL